MSAASGVGIPYEYLTGDIMDVSDRTLRVVINTFRRRLEQYQYYTFVQMWCRQVWAAFIDACVLAGHIKAADFSKNKWDYLRCNWIGQGWAYIHPVQDVEAKIKSVRAGFSTRSSVILESGEDPETIMRQYAHDNEIADSLGLVMDTDPRQDAT